MTNFIIMYLSDKFNCDLYQDVDYDKFPNSRTKREWDMHIGDLISTGVIIERKNRTHFSI